MVNINMSVLYRLIEVGANLHYAEVVLFYPTALWFWTVAGEWGEDIRSLASWNIQASSPPPPPHQRP